MISAAYILTMVFAVIGGGLTTSTITVSYDSKTACEQALEANRQALSMGKVILATCTRKGS